jgi:hypothetical protein
MIDRQLDLATAREVAPGTYQAECPTTHTLFLSMTGRHTGVSGRAAVWCVCACCDADLHTGDDCDPRAPQFHLYWLVA